MKYLIIKLLKWLLHIMEKPKKAKKFKIPRSSEDGKIVTKQYAKENPNTTVIETVVRDVNESVTSSDSHENETML